MLTLRTIHLGVILLSIVGADLVGAWAIGQYRSSGDGLLLALGILVLLGGFGLVVYSWRVVRSFDRAGIR